MGCGSSVVRQKSEIEEQWDRVWETVEVKKPKGNMSKNLVVKRSGWKTIRIFVSSTFRDFHHEREILVKKVFPDLRIWCQSRRLHLVECDLRWGVPKDSTTETTLRTCLEEIDRCYQDNIMPFFVNMTSERIGWIPIGEEVPASIKSEYKWVDGLSVTEMEIMHASYRKDNPNSIFMLRDPSFIETVPEEHKDAFIDPNPVATDKLKMLKKMIEDRYTKDRVRLYNCSFDYFDTEESKVKFCGLDGVDKDTFSKIVFDFFKNRIEHQYPLADKESEDPYERIKEKHEAFMKASSAVVIGRDETLEKVNNYICGPGIDKPLLLIGGAGTGKSSIMARLADTTYQKSVTKSIPGGGSKGWHVFYHFVGAVPGSTELEKLLKRLLKEMGVVDASNMPKDLESAAQVTCGALNNQNTRPTIIIIDALNQFDSDLAAELVSWVPKKLAPQIRCIFTMIPETPQHYALISREPQPDMFDLEPLDMESRKQIVEEMLGKYNKALDTSQMDSLLSKTSSDNPLWLSLACEELRVFGNFRKVSDKINQLRDGLLELEMQIMTRFEEESGGELLVATLCLLESSSTGLLETELLMILGDTDNLMPREQAEGAEKDDTSKEKSDKNKTEALAAYKWAEVYRALRPFLRPFGDSGEGRLDFYHRSLSKAVRQKYFKDDDIKKWWHKKLADYFETLQNIDRKVEEYPHHLLFLDDKKRLKDFLTDWAVFTELFDIEFSTKLCKYWTKTCALDEMEEHYVTKMQNLVNDERNSKELIALRTEQMARFMSQMGRYDRGFEYASKAEAFELDLGARPHRMAEIYHLLAIVADEHMKLEEFMYRSQLPRMKVIIDNFEKSVELRRTFEGVEHQHKLGLALNRLAFYYSGWSIRGGDAALNAKDAKSKAIDRVEEAIKLYTEIEDEFHLGDALITRGVTEGSANTSQIKFYKEAEAKILQSAGELNVSYDRLLLNMAIYYEEMGDYNTAYAKFYKWYEVCKDFYGIHHAKVARSINTLREPMYKRLAQEKGVPVPEEFDGDIG
ncbi:unnamed protein product [Owenia fusiformis]|uniref:Telomerase protein component 1 n=1 Tax=Owenia fusiformis TaxID=6347 RepID=A0A8S4NTI0_OWEFU|nr:unnamed protein product [Owenia fusiformis]